MLITHPKDFVHIGPDGKVRAKGLIPRNYNTHPSGYLAHAPTFPDDLLIPESQWASLLADQIAQKASLFDHREANYDVLKSLDQDGLGLCWAFSSSKAMMYLRILAGMSGLILSPWWVAGLVKKWRDEGGWGAESTTEIASVGIPAMSMCPSYKSSYDTAETRANAALHKCIQWYDGTEDRDKNRAIMASSFLLGNMVPVLDYNWLSHSMCGCRMVDLALTVDCDNSWGESAGTKGLYRLTGEKAIPDGIVVAVVQAASQT
jgi:hypothetical protein